MLNLFAQVTFLAAEGGNEPEGIDLVIPEINELIAGVIAFAIVFLAIWLWARPAIGRTLAARQGAITGRLEAAERTKVEAEGLLQDYRQQVADAKGEADRIVQEAKTQAEGVRSELLARAETEAAEITRKAREEAAAEKERAAAQVRDEVVALSLALTEKVVGTGMDADAQRAMIDRYIDDLEGLA